MIWIAGIILGLFVLVSITAYIFMQQKSFGKLPQGARYERMLKSPNYRNGGFQNIMPTPQLAEGVKPLDIAKEKLLKKIERLRPTDEIPSVRTDLKNLDPGQDVLVWFGHSSYFIQIDGKRILVDPVFCGHASPASFMIRAFKGTDVYNVDDMPQIDYLFITHDHWDHLDYQTVCGLKQRIGKVVCGLGVGEHLQMWGFDTSRIIEMDWNEEATLEDGFRVYCLPTRHFSGRTTKRNTSLWISCLLQTPSMKIYIGGDGGYGEHFADIGERFGPVDLAILENGQYDFKWKYIHCMPEQVVRAAGDLHAKSFMPVHLGKFALAEHPWDEPLKRIWAYYSANNCVLDVSGVGANKPRMLTPMIGKQVNLKDSTQFFARWWESVE